MSQVYPMDPIIKRVSSPDEVLPDSGLEKLLIWDNGKREVLGKKPFLTSLYRELKYYRVCPRGSMTGDGPEFKLNDLGTNQSITLKIKYEAHCIPGQEKKLVEALHRGSHPGEALNDLIRARVAKYRQDHRSGNQGDIIGGYFSIHRYGLGEAIRDAALEAGLELRVFPLLENEDKLGVYEFTSDHFPVRVKDCDEAVNIRFTAALEVLEGDERILAVLNFLRLGKLKEGLQETIKSAISKKVGLHDLYYRLEDRVRSELEPELNKILAPQGRRIMRLVLERSGPAAPELTESLAHKVDIHIKDCPTPIGMQHTLLVDLEDLGKFRQAKTGNLKDWIKSKLQEITQSQLFEKTYADLLKGFEQDSGQGGGEPIKERMVLEMQAIGYRIRHLISLPDSQHFKLKDAFQFENTGTYVTSNSRVPVKLSVFVSGRVKNLKDIEKYLIPNMDFVVKLRDCVEQETAKVLHGTDPERLYMKFAFTRPGDPVKPVREILQESISGKILKEFKVEITEVIPKILDNEITTRFLKLQEGGSRRFEVKASPLHAHGTKESVLFNVRYSVEGVTETGWHKFQNRRYASGADEINEIAEVLKDKIRATLEILSAQDLYYYSFEQKKKITQIVQMVTRACMDEDFGLDIKIIEVWRDITEAEIAENEKLRFLIQNRKDLFMQSESKQTQAVMDELDTFLEKKLALIRAGAQADDPDLENIMNGVERTREELASTSFDVDKKKIKSLSREAPHTPDVDNILNELSSRRAKISAPKPEKVAEAEGMDP